MRHLKYISAKSELLMGFFHLLLTSQRIKWKIDLALIKTLKRLFLKRRKNGEESMEEVRLSFTFLTVGNCRKQISICSPVLYWGWFSIVSSEPGYMIHWKICNWYSSFFCLLLHAGFCVSVHTLANLIMEVMKSGGGWIHLTPFPASFFRSKSKSCLILWMGIHAY